MRKFIITLLFLPVLAYAEESNVATVDKPVKCMPTRVVFETLKKDFKEVLAAHSINDINKTHIAITQSPNGTWTIIEFNEQVACLLAVGTDLDLTGLLPKPTM